MKRILIFTHGSLSAGYVSALNVIASGVEFDLQALSLDVDTTNDDLEKGIDTFFENSNEEDILLAITDIVIGSTTKFLIPYMDKYKNLFIVSGINLPTILELLLSDLTQDTELKIRSILLQGQKTLVFVNDLINGKEE